ncbi:MAG: hypothetical protein JW866_11155, partial [Ignavibacteriales bacterium]|nr:hypothetical protein [Ignavibacteriales bacterium]
MKALKYLTILLFCIKINAEKLPPPPCELLFYSKDNSFLLKVKVTLIDGYGWKYNYSTNHYDYYSSHTITQQDLGTIGFDSPFSPTTSNVLCWGKYKIEFSCYKNGYYTKTRTFYLDLRDENWAENYNPSHDTYFWYDYNNDEVTMTRYEEEIPELPDPPILPKETGKVIIYENDDIKLWEFWGYPNPNIANFKVPVILKNIVENTTYQFGQLSANGKVINSGSTEEFNYESGTVSHYTLETIYNSKRNYSFKWNYDNVTKIGLQNIYNATTSFDPWNIIEEYKVIRNFKTVYPLTIKTNLPENENISAGNILFKNPTTTNQFETKSAAGDGFILNEAFDSLMEDLGLPELQKYSVKALDNFEYGGYKYYWYGGDFNPTTNTDLLITAPTNKTAYYKGSMISNDAGALSNNSQKKIISVNNTEYVVYESMNKIWLERSIDGGISWSLMNNRQPLNTSEAKHPSITYIYDTQNEINDIYIVYQEKATDGKYKIVLDKINKQGLKVFSQVVHESPNSYNHNSTPIIISSRSGMDKKVAVIIRELNYNGSSSGLYRISGNDIGTSVFWSGPPSTMTRFDFAGVNAINPAISGLRVSDGNPIYYLCWEEDNNIKYCKLEHSPSQLYKPSTEVVQVISSGSGLTINNRPSISIYDRLSNEYYEDYYPIISWTGDNKAVVRLKNSSSSWSNFEVFGTNVNNTNICGELNNNTIVVWSENNGFSCKYSKMLNGIFHNEQILNYSGLFPQLPIENLSLEDYVMNESLETFILKTSNLPYEITKTEYQWTIPNNITKYFEIPVGVYTFNNDITIEQTGSLTIAPGSTIKFAPGKKLLVKGSLNAVGSFSQKIIFTSTTTSKWSGIQIGEGSYTDNQSIIDYCDINTATTGVLVY